MGQSTELGAKSEPSNAYNSHTITTQLVMHSGFGIEAIIFGQSHRTETHV